MKISEERRTTIGRVLAFTAAMMGMAMTGSCFTVNLYSNALKDTFNLTETEVGNMAAVLTVGMNNGIVPALVSDVMGLFGLSVIGFLLTPTAYFLIWSSFFWESFYRRYNGLLVLYYGMAGLGASFIFMACLLATTVNFSTRHRGKAIGLIEAAMVGIAPAIFSSIYSAVFSNGKYNHPKEQNAQGYLLMMAIGSAASYLVCVVFLRFYPREDESTSLPEINVSVTKKDSVCSTEDEYTDSVGSTSKVVALNFPSEKSYAIYVDNENANEAMPLLPKPRFQRSKTETLYKKLKEKISFFFFGKFQCILWAFVFTGGIMPVYINNIPVILQSGNNSDFQPLLTTLSPVSAVVSSIVATTASDALLHKCPRTVFVLLYTAMFAACLLLLGFLSMNIVAVTISTVVIGSSTGFIWGLMVPMVGEMLGKEHFGRNWGCMSFFSAIINYVSQFVFSYFYDLHANADKLCFGVECYQVTFITMSLLAFTAIIMLVVLLVRYKKTTR